VPCCTTIKVTVCLPVSISVKEGISSRVDVEGGRWFGTAVEVVEALAAALVKRVNFVF